MNSHHVARQHRTLRLPRRRARTGRFTRAAHIERLEARTLLTGVTLTDGLLRIEGSAGNDTILIESAAGTQAKVTINAAVDMSFALADIEQIQVVAGNGNDTITLVDLDDYDTTTVMGVNGQLGNDTLIVQDTNPLEFRVIFDGGAGVDRLQGPDVANAWNINVANGGTLNTMLRFGNVESLTGGTNKDTFAFARAATLGGNIDGGGNTDTVSYAGYVTPVKVDLKANIATGVGGLLNVEVIGGGSAGDTIIGPNLANTWNITGANSGDVNLTTSFSGFENLNGGTLADTFKFADGASINGKIDGRGGSNTIDFSAYMALVQINLQAKTFAGVQTGSFANVQSFVGSSGLASTRLIGQNANVTWNITDNNAGNVNGFKFTDIDRLIGGTRSDRFLLSDGKGVSGGISGGGGTDSLNYSLYTAVVAVNLATTAATGIPNFASIEGVVGGSALDTLTGRASNLWTLTSGYTGNADGFTFSAIESLVGGTGGDTFFLPKGKGFLGSIDGGGGAGINQLDYSSYVTSVSVDLQGGTATNIFGGIDNISDVFGGSAGDTILGGDLANIADNFLFGNGGNDYIDGRGGDDLLAGGNGNDTLIGQAGRDLLFGGLGADSLSGGADEDILFNGSTSFLFDGTTRFDTDIGDLSSVYGDWTGPGNFETRVAQLRSSAPLDFTTIFNDQFTDTLNGGDALDWYFAKLNPPAKDIISVLAAGEVVN